MKLKNIENNWTKFETEGRIAVDEDVQSRARIGFNNAPGQFTATIEGTLSTFSGFSVAFEDEIHFQFDQENDKVTLQQLEEWMQLGLVIFNLGLKRRMAGFHLMYPISFDRENYEPLLLQILQRCPGAV